MVLKLLVRIEAQPSHHQLVQIDSLIYVLIHNLNSIGVAVNVLELGSVRLISCCMKVEERVYFDLDAKRVRRSLGSYSVLSRYHLAFVAFLCCYIQLLRIVVSRVSNELDREVLPVMY